MMKANKKVMAALLAAMMTVSAGATLVSAAPVQVPGPGSSVTNPTTGTWYGETVIENGKVITKYTYKDAGSDTIVKNAWRYISGAWYYFGVDGVALSSQLGDGSGRWSGAALGYTDEYANTYFRFDENCKMVTGWYQTKAADAARPTDPVAAGNWEYYGENGAMKMGWYKVGANWFYTKKSSDVVNKINADGTKTAIAEDKQLLMNGTYEINGVKYTFAANGVMQNQGQGWVKNGNDWYYMENGANVTGKLVEGRGDIYTADSWKLINGKYYLFGTDGKMLTGWRKARNANNDTKWYYCTANGDLIMNNWIQIGNAWYLTNPSGEMLTGWQVRNGKTYLLNTESNQYGNYGAMVTGTRVPVATNAYATFDASGALVSIVNNAGESITLPSLG